MLSRIKLSISIPLNFDFRNLQCTDLCKSYHSGVHTSYGIYENMVGTLTDLGNIFSSPEPVSFSLVNTIRIEYL